MSEVVCCPDDHAHEANGVCYIVHKCRCKDCRRGRAEYEFWRTHMRAAGKEFRVDATGTHRRLRALGAIGWSGRLIGMRYGFSPTWVSCVLEVERVTPQTAERVRGIYADLCMSAPPAVTKHERGAVSKAKKWARDNGYPPPLAWDDESIDDPSAQPAEGWEPVQPATVGLLQRMDTAIVEAAIRGEKPKLSPLERHEAVTQLHARRWSSTRIASWLGCTSRTVERIRARSVLESFSQADVTAA